MGHRKQESHDNLPLPSFHHEKSSSSPPFSDINMPQTEDTPENDISDTPIADNVLDAAIQAANQQNNKKCIVM